MTGLISLQPKRPLYGGHIQCRKWLLGVGGHSSLFFPYVLVFLLLVKQVTRNLGALVQFSPILCDPVNYIMPGLPVHHQLLEFTKTHVHQLSDAIQPSHPLSSPSPPAPNPSQLQGLFQRVNSLHEVAKY